MVDSIEFGEFSASSLSHLLHPFGSDAAFAVLLAVLEALPASHETWTPSPPLPYGERDGGCGQRRHRRTPFDESLAIAHTATRRPRERTREVALPVGELAGDLRLSPHRSQERGRDHSADVLAEVQPIWANKREAASRVRQRTSAVMKWASHDRRSGTQMPSTRAAGTVISREMKPRTDDHGQRVHGWSPSISSRFN